MVHINFGWVTVYGDGLAMRHRDISGCLTAMALYSYRLGMYKDKTLPNMYLPEFKAKVKKSCVHLGR